MPSQRDGQHRSRRSDRHGSGRPTEDLSLRHRSHGEQNSAFTDSDTQGDAQPGRQNPANLRSPPSHRLVYAQSDPSPRDVIDSHTSYPVAGHESNRRHISSAHNTYAIGRTATRDSLQQPRSNLPAADQLDELGSQQGGQASDMYPPITIAYPNTSTAPSQMTLRGMSDLMVGGGIAYNGPQSQYYMDKRTSTARPSSMSHNHPVTMHMPAQSQFPESVRRIDNTGHDQGSLTTDMLDNNNHYRGASTAFPPPVHSNTRSINGNSDRPSIGGLRPLNRAMPAQQSWAYPTTSAPIHFHNGDPSLVDRSKVELRQSTTYAAEGFNVRDGDGKQFFQVGKVLQVVWSQPAGAKQEANPNMSSNVFTKLMWMLVVVRRSGYSICCPISTYGKQGVSKAGLPPGEARAHSIIFSSGHSSTKYEGEDELVKEPIPVDMDYGREPLHPASRVHFGKFHTVEWNVPVRGMGKVHLDFRETIKHYFMEELQGKPAQRPPQNRQVRSAENDMESRRGP